MPTPSHERADADRLHAVRYMFFASSNLNPKFKMINHILVHNIKLFHREICFRARLSVVEIDACEAQVHGVHVAGVLHEARDALEAQLCGVHFASRLEHLAVERPSVRVLLVHRTEAGHVDCGRRTKQGFPLLDKTDLSEMFADSTQ